MSLALLPRALALATLPELAEPRHNAAAVALPDGRAMVTGGFGNAGLDSVEVLAEDGSGHAIEPCTQQAAARGHAWGALYCRLACPRPRRETAPEGVLLHFELVVDKKPVISATAPLDEHVPKTRFHLL